MDGRTGEGLRTTAAVSAALTTAVLPVFLIGATSDAIREDLGISETAIGGAVTVLFVSVGLSAGPVGRLTERLGASRALRAGVLLSAVATALAGGLARSWWQLAAPLLLVGVAIGLIDTGGARAFADRITAGRQGLAFGIKEASVPAASLLAGVALPTLAAAFGWRAAFLAAPVLAALVLLILPRRAGDVPTATAPADELAARAATSSAAESSPAGEAPPEVRAALLRFAIGVALGAGAATAAATFLVPAATSRGLSTNVAGTLLVVASVASIAARIGLGRWSDRAGAEPTRAVTIMLAAGGLGAGALALAIPGPLVVVAAIAVLGAGWGWTGLAFLAAVRARPAAPAVAAGTVLTGLGIGGALGPLAFGGLASTWSYRVAWAAAAGALLVASGLAASASTRTTRRPADQAPSA